MVGYTKAPNASNGWRECQSPRTAPNAPGDAPRSKIHLPGHGFSGVRETQSMVFFSMAAIEPLFSGLEITQGIEA